MRTTGRSDNVMVRGRLASGGSEKAWHVEIELPADMKGERVWLPKSECHAYSNNTVFAVPEWLARQKGLA